MLTVISPNHLPSHVFAHHQQPSDRQRLSRVVLLIALLVAYLNPLVNVATVQQEARPRIDPAGISGTLVICGGGSLPKEVIGQFMELAGGKEARLVVIPTAGDRADNASAEQNLLARWKQHEPESLTLLHTRSRETANSPDFVKPLTQATAVWFSGGSQSKIAEAYLDTAVEREIHALLKRGGVVGGTSAGAAIMSGVMIARGNPHPQIARGLDLLPDAIIDQHFLARRRKPRLIEALEKHPGLVGFGIDEGTALAVRGRRMRVVGESSVTVILSASESRPLREIELTSGMSADLTALRRAALARSQPVFPPAELAAPVVEKGSLVIVGGGGMPMDVTRKFIELAGGDEALIVVLPTAQGDPLPERLGEELLFRRAGAKNVKALRARTLEEVESPEFLEVMAEAGGVWFGGGRQWRFVDAYQGTKAYEALHAVLRRGGVIGGSSAGASIQAEYLVRGHPLGNRVMMAEGYERGFAFLPGVAIDQHFAQRKRFADMTAVVDRFPQLLGIGIDEATALIVHGQTADVVGRNNVQFYDRSKPSVNGEPDYEVVEPGNRYDLKERKVQAETPVGQ